MPELFLSEFADKLQEIMPVLIREFAKRQAAELYTGRITLPQFLILDFLYKKGDSKMKDMAHFMAVSTAAMTGITDRLVRDGYVVRAYDLKDRRVIKIKLTFKGNRVVEKINQQRRKMIIKLFSQISFAERKDYLRVLMRIHDILIKERDSRCAK